MNPENPQTPDNGPLPLDKVMDEFFTYLDEHPDGMRDLLDQEEQRARLVNDKERELTTQELRELITKRERGEADDVDQDQIKILRTELWGQVSDKLNQEDQITKDDQ